MSGGIALTVYEAGVAHELWRAATGQGAANAYRDALQHVDGRVILDIVTGASAGGINAIMLGSALSTGADFSKLHDVWLKAADFSKLEYQKSPESLLDTRAIREELESMLGANMRAPSPVIADVAKQEDLRVTVTRTNLGGRRRLLTDYLQHTTVVVTKEDPITFAPSDFAREDRLDDLVKAALATSAFPVVFPPVKMRERLGGMRQSYYADGGLLDNQPVGWAIRHIRDKKAASRTRRFVIFVEPNPDTSQPPPEPERPGVSEVALQIPSMGLKGNIWNAITELEDFNYRLSNYEGLIAAASANLTERSEASARDILASRLAEALEAPLPSDDATYAMQRLLANARFDELFLDHVPLRYARWRSVATFGFPTEPDRVAWQWKVIGVAADVDFYLRWLRALIRGINVEVKRRAEHPERPERLDTTQRLIRPARGPVSAELREGAPARPEPVVKEILYDALSRLLDALYPKADATSPFQFARRLDTWQGYVEKVSNQADISGDDRNKLKEAIEKFPAEVEVWTNASPKATMAEILATVEDLARRNDDFASICVAVCGLAKPTEQTSFPFTGRQMFDAFRRRDLADYVLDELTDLNHKAEIQFVRISPNDANNLHLIGKQPVAGTSQAPTKLAGELFGHMGGFLDERWRRNDYIWGRLDAAEVLLDVLARVYPDLMSTKGVRLRQLQVEILREEYQLYSDPRRPLHEPGPDNIEANQEWIGYGEDSLTSLEPEVVRDAAGYILDTSAALMNGNPYLPASLLKRPGRLLRGLAIPVRFASWLFPRRRGRVHRGWYVLAAIGLAFGLGYVLGHVKLSDMMDGAGPALWIAAGIFFVFLLGAVAGWHLWLVLPLATALSVLVGALAGPALGHWVTATLGLPQWVGLAILVLLGGGAAFWLAKLTEKGIRLPS